MNEADAIEIASKAVWTVIVVCGPAVAAAMIVGIVIGLIQALTQIQEATLTFIPKILAVLLVICFTSSMMGAKIYSYTQLVYNHIENGF